MATEAFNYFYSFTKVSNTQWVIGQDISGSGTFSLTESAPFVDGLFAHYTNGYAKKVGATDGNEQLTGSDGKIYYYRGVIVQNGINIPFFSTDSIGGGGGTRTFFAATDYPLPATTTLNPSSLQTGISTAVTCYLAGTLIGTPSGETPIEDLKPGDLVETQDGPRPIRFIARTTRSLAALRDQGRLPIRIRAGALGEQLPEQDLWLSPSHAVLLQGYLIEAGALLHGQEISQPEDPGQLMITYYNIELEQHAIIRANGLEIETYFANWRSNGFSRESWDNYQEYVALHGPGSSMEELPHPRIPFARQLPVDIRLQLQLREQSLRTSV